jgi:ribonuclease J
MAKHEKLRLIPLGGMGEIGKNLFVIEYDKDILIIDAGLMFPEEDMPGVDLVLPDYTYLKDKVDRIVGIVITHGHEDHTGALPYMLREINVPVYATRLTLGLIKGKLEEFELDDVTLCEIDPNQDLILGAFKLQFMRVNHSIPDGVGLAIHTPAGIIVHSGDFKFDPTPVDGRATDFSKFAALGEQNVLLLMSDSTNAEVPGHTLPEKTVGETLIKIFDEAKGRIIVVSFASHIHRIQQIVDVAKNAGRKIAISGRNMKTNINIASELGYLKIPEEMIIDLNDVSRLTPTEIVVLCTGSQGEPLSALVRMASHEHKQVQILPGDTVIISATPIPGNEVFVSRTIDQLFRCGANVFYEEICGVHVSGHASQEELKLMVSMIKPHFFIPIHGEFRHLKHHSDIAIETGIAPENIFLLDNGDVLEISDTTARRTSKVQAGVIYVDGLGVGDIGDVVLRDRQQLTQDGILIVVLTISKHSKNMINEPDLISRGFVYFKHAKQLIEEAKELVIKQVERSAKEDYFDWPSVKSEVRETLSRFFYQRTRRRPMILPIILEV